MSTLDHDESQEQDVQRHWDDRYAARGRIWSGRANGQLVAIATPLAPGRALDLGCGEGGDAAWLAEHGWQVLAVDVSPTALRRAAAEAESRGVRDRIDFQHHDLSDSFPDGEFDLASAQYLHSFVRLERPRILRRAAEAVRLGGLLLIVDHGAPPPWASPDVRHHRFPEPEEVLDELELPVSAWERVRVEAVQRATTDPDGNPATLTDNLMVLRRVADAASSANEYIRVR